MFGGKPLRNGLRSAPAGTARTALLLFTALACSGCGLQARQEATGVTPTDYRLRHPIAIREGKSTLEVFVGARRGGLTPAQRADVAGFVRGWRQEATGGIILDVPKGTPNARAAADVAREIRAALAQMGVPPNAVVTRAYQPPDIALLATVKLIYPKMGAQAGPCGFWPQDLGLPHDAEPTQNHPYWNHGCSNQRNLAAMVDNPADLVQPRAETPIYAQRRSIIFDKHRKGESSATNYPRTSGFSDVGR